MRLVLMGMGGDTRGAFRYVARISIVRRRGDMREGSWAQSATCQNLSISEVQYVSVAMLGREPWQGNAMVKAHALYEPRYWLTF
jgi:hypothetical protein